jgi:hypothetical protein
LPDPLKTTTQTDGAAVLEDFPRLQLSWPPSLIQYRQDDNNLSFGADSEFSIPTEREEIHEGLKGLPFPGPTEEEDGSVRVEGTVAPGFISRGSPSVSTLIGDDVAGEFGFGPVQPGSENRAAGCPVPELESFPRLEDEQVLEDFPRLQPFGSGQTMDGAGRPALPRSPQGPRLSRVSVAPLDGHPDALRPRSLLSDDESSPVVRPSRCHDLALAAGPHRAPGDGAPEPQSPRSAQFSQPLSAMALLQADPRAEHFVHQALDQVLGLPPRDQG